MTRSVRAARRVLEPDERIAEVLFGLIMALTFTGSLSVAEAGREEVRAMLIGALGCNLAWGTIDGIFYLMGCLSDTGQSLARLRALRTATDEGQARLLISTALPPLIASVLQPSEFESIRERLLALPEPAKTARLRRQDLVGGLGVFILVTLSTFPVTLPFMIVPQAAIAMRLSNAVALVMLFVTGFAYGRVVGRSPWGFAFGMVLLGGALVALTIALGG